MKLWVLSPILVIAMGCSGESKHIIADPGIPGSELDVKSNEPAAKDTTGPKEVEKFSNSIFRIPIYPGSEKIEFTSLEMDTDVTHAYARTFSSKDGLDKVEAFIKDEGSKLGNHSNPMSGVFNDSILRNGVFEFSDGFKLVYKLTRNEKTGQTMIMYNISELKKK